jgi:hypothetical protein
MYKKRILTASVAMAGVLAMTACSGGSGGSAAGGGGDGKTLTLAATTN